MPSEAELEHRVARIALDPALERIMIPSTPSINIRFRSPLASSSTARSETLRIAALMALTIPSLTSRARTEQIGKPWTETIALPVISELTASIFRSSSVSSLMFSLKDNST